MPYTRQNAPSLAPYTLHPTKYTLCPTPNTDLFIHLQGVGAKDAQADQRMEELEKIVQHAIFREYPDVLPGVCFFFGSVRLNVLVVYG